MVRPVGPGVTRYYLQGSNPGMWSGNGSASLGLNGAPTGVTLRRVLQGAHPLDGHPLGHRHPHRRAGWDLIFAAPKSVSLLAALARSDDGQLIQTAHRRAVESTVGWLEGDACWARRGRQRVAAEGVVAAVFHHGTSAAGDPHLHSHVVVANLVRGPDERWSALDSSALWQARLATGALYALALRHEMTAAGFGVGWVIDTDGMADIAGVPRQAIDAVSSRHQQMRAALEARAPDSPELTRRARHLASVGSREAHPDTVWQQRLALVGFGAEHVAPLLRPLGRWSTISPSPALSKTTTSGALDAATRASAEGWLAERASTWSRSEAFKALAATVPGGASPQTAKRWVNELCQAAEAAGSDRWTTSRARRFDDVLCARSVAGPPTFALATERTIADVLDQRPQLSHDARALVRRLAGGGAPVDVVPGAPGRSTLVEQAAVIDAARSAWEATGLRVAIDTPVGAVARWTALAALGPPDSAAGVVVVDRADRRSPRELAEIVTQAATTHTKIILIEGGTLPTLRRPRCGALSQIPTARAIDESLVHPRAVLDTGDFHRRLPAAVTTTRSTVCSSLGDAVDIMIDTWVAAPAGSRPLLVGLGPAEVDALNEAARVRLQAAGHLAADGTKIGGRAFSVGDRVVALRGTPGPGAQATRGSMGTVAEVSRRPATLTVRWDGGHGDPTVLSAWDARHLSHGYAVGSPLATRIATPALVLGDPAAVASRRESQTVGVVIALTAARTPPVSDHLARLADQVRPVDGRRSTSTGRWVTVDPAARSLADLARERQQLGRHLRDSLPADVSGDARRLGENLAWYGRLPRRTNDHERQELQRLSTSVERGEAALHAWSSVHADDLRRWKGLGLAMDRRADLVTHALAVDSTNPEHHLIGRDSDDPLTRQAWRRATRAVAVHADRWPEDHDVAIGDPAARASRRLRDRAVDELAGPGARSLSAGRGRNQDLDNGLGL